LFFSPLRLVFHVALLLKSFLILLLLLRMLRAPVGDLLFDPLQMQYVSIFFLILSSAQNTSKKRKKKTGGY